MALYPELDIVSRLSEATKSVMLIDSKFKEYFLDKKIYCTGKITTSEICRIMEVSQKELNDYFYATHGHSLAKAIDNYRIDEALAIMQLDPDISIYKLSRDVGYSCSLTFLYHFVGYQRCLPSAWRHRNI